MSKTIRKIQGNWKKTFTRTFVQRGTRIVPTVFNSSGTTRVAVESSTLTKRQKANNQTEIWLHTINCYYDGDILVSSQPPGVARLPYKAGSVEVRLHDSLQHSTAQRCSSWHCSESLTAGSLPPRSCRPWHSLKYADTTCMVIHQLPVIPEAVKQN